MELVTDACDGTSNTNRELVFVPSFTDIVQERFIQILPALLQTTPHLNLLNIWFMLSKYTVTVWVARTGKNRYFMCLTSGGGERRD